ncbi:MAG TPA: hypothetical protein VH350_18825 [Candidatus Sulfotelmatobacter sp.]|nr:hypothetical protein [Candidatus Sulfotelmatobacter sp.]
MKTYRRDDRASSATTGEDYAPKALGAESFRLKHGSGQDDNRDFFLIVLER